LLFISNYDKTKLITFCKYYTDIIDSMYLQIPNYVDNVISLDFSMQKSHFMQLFILGMQSL